MNSDALAFKHHHREKLINAIIYFVRETERCHALKLFKLLYFFDFEHFRQTAFSVTGLTYKAWPNGPAPSELWHEMRSPKRDLSQAVHVYNVKEEFTDKSLRTVIRPIKLFDASWFSKREAKIMERLAFYFKETGAEDMRDISHAKNFPWGKVYRDGKGKGEIIPYELALTSRRLIEDMPTLSEDEYKYRREAFAGIE